MFSLRTAAAFVAFAVILGSMTGCGVVARAAVAEAVGYVAENAFFGGDLGDGLHLGRNLTDKGGSHKGSEAGLYGGSREIDVCEPELLLEFLLDARNVKKKNVWAKALGTSAENKNVRKYVTSLTEVVLSNDTLVANHGYKKGRANRYDAVLEAGTAVLVDVFGVPRVKCNCGNPLAVSEHEPGDVDITFSHQDKGNKKWKVKKNRVVRVEKADKPQDKMTVVDVKDPAERVEIDLPPEPDVTGTARVTVPQVRGLSEAEATQRLKGQGFAVRTKAFDDPDVDPGFAAGTEPDGGSTADGESTVTLLIAADSPAGTPSVDVPSVVGRGQADAEQAIRDAGLVPSVVLQAASAEQAGIVIAQSPAGGQAETDSTVTLTVGQATTDGGTVDGGAVDGGTADGGTIDGGAVDGGTADGGAVDGGTVDDGTAGGAGDAGADAGTGV
ncbi:DUF6777 domain-containing protein [Streptomyces atriruber]|uniref:DUF6777 domain-containing protein n=1 Tax=Streptomyces atriruber TaxID=545121 RepID=A0ABV3BQ50_9ACTN